MFQIDPHNLGGLKILDIEDIKIHPTTVIGTAKGKFMLRFKEI